MPDLISRLGNRARDPPPPQISPVGAGTVGLCPPEHDPACSGLTHHRSARPGPWPAPPRITTLPGGHQQPPAVLSAGHPRCGRLRRAGGPVDRGIHAHLPGNQPGGVGSGLQPGQDHRPHPGTLPAPEQAIDGLPADAVQKLALCPCRWAASFLPTGSSGSRIAHCASVRSARPVAARLGTRSPVFLISLVVDRSTGEPHLFDPSHAAPTTPTRSSAGQHIKTGSSRRRRAPARRRPVRRRPAWSASC